MRYLLFLLIYFSVCLPVFSQRYGGSDENGLRYVYADIANVRETWGLNANIIDKLKVGQEVKIKDVGAADRIGDNDSFWLHITYTADNVQKEGFVWGPTLSHTQLRRGNVKFVYGKESGINENGNVLLRVKAVKDDSIIDKIDFELPASSLSSTEGRIRSNGNLENIEYIVQLYFTGEACGLGSYEFNFAWNGSHFLQLPYTLSVGDAGVYAYSEYLLYPTDNQLPEGIILKVIAEGEAPDKDSEIEFKYKTVIYKWDGRNATLIND